MTMLNIEDSVVMIIDVQEKLLNAVFNKASLEKKATTLANTAKILGIPVIVTEQYPKGLGATVESLKEALPENTQYFEKTAFSALENNDVLEALKNSGKKQVVIFGIETHICVSQTTNALIQEGFEVSVIRDACGSRSELEYLAGLERMKDNGAHVLTTEIALFEWLKGAKHPKFKEVQMLIK
ncbi:hydrolase [bacterium]|nr:hydrolase [bacterium]